VVTYVANADNYRQQSKQLSADLRASREKEKSAKKQMEENIAKSQQLQDKLNEQIASLQQQISQLKTDLNNVEREKATLLAKVNSWTSIVKDFSQTNEKQGQLLKNTLAELNRVQAEQVKLKKNLDETSTTLLEKMAVIETLQADKKRLVEEKTELQNRLDQVLRPAGEVTAALVPVTPKKELAKPAPPVREIGLKGLITKVDLKNSMASISIGSADGVKKDMKFYVTRGDEFICEIAIIGVETEESVGILKLVQQPPKVGDNVTTNL